ncbi:hypothetical protein ACJZ2D_003438 [Fusarium nematophilum]
MRLYDMSYFVNETRGWLTEYENGSPTLKACMHGLRTAEKALESAPKGHKLRWSTLVEVALWRHKLFIDHSHDVQDLGRAADELEEAWSALPVSSVNRSLISIQLAAWYLERSRRSYDVRHVYMAMNKYFFAREECKLAQKHLQSTELPSTATEKTHFTDLKELDPASLGELYYESLKGQGGCENQVYQLRSDMGSLNRAVDEYERALPHAPGDVTLLRNLVQCLQGRWVRDGRPESLDRSIELLETWASLAPEDPLALGELGRTLGWRFAERGHPGDLATSITRGCEALRGAGSSSGNVQSLNIKAWLSDSLNLKFCQLGNPLNLDQAIQLSRESTEESAGDFEQALRLCSYADRLGSQFDTQGDYGDVATAIQCLETSLGFTSDTSLNAWAIKQTSRKIRACLAIMRLRQFNAHGGIQDLDRGIEELVRYPVMMHDCLQDRVWQLALNTGRLLARNSHSRSIEDVNKAIEAARTALEALSPGDGRRPAFLGLLSYCYRRQATEAQSSDGLDRATEATLQALAQVSDCRRHRCAYLVMVAENFRSRSTVAWEQGLSREHQDSDKAIQYALEARSESQDTANFGHATILLAECFKSRFQQSNVPDPDDIDQTIEYFKQALRLEEIQAESGEDGYGGASNPNQTRRSSLAFKLALAYSLRAATANSEAQKQQDEHNALQMFNTCIETPLCPPRDQFLASTKVAEHHFSSRRWTEAVQVWQRTLGLVPSLSLRSQSQQDRVDFLQHLAGVSRRASAAALNAGASPTEALKLLELGRGLVAVYILEARADLDKLDPHVQDSELGQWVSEFLDYHEAEQELQSVVASIRADQKTRYFLEPPSLEQVREFLGDDIIVEINTSAERCDAFVIEKKREDVRAIRLGALKFDDVEDWLARLKSSRPLVDLSMLEWLWSTVAHPILEDLGFGETTSSPDTQLPRIIWIMTGPLSHFPIHAAGIYDGSSRTVMDRVLSSHSFSLGAFVLSHMWEHLNTFHPPEDAMLLVGMDKTPGLPNLLFAVQEVSKLTDMAYDMNRDPVCLTEPRRDAVLAELSKCEIFHYAGHGVSDPLRPLNSGLVLQYGHLTIADLLDNRIAGKERGPPFLAFLSACLTGVNDLEHLVDEGIHLISAFQLVGFEHVIGTLWQVKDETCLAVADGVYADMVAKMEESVDVDEDAAVCGGLHKAVMAVRNEWMKKLREHSKNYIKGESHGRGEEEEEDLAMEMRPLQIRLARARQRGERNARLRVKGPKMGKLVRADWIPFVHYGILRNPRSTAGGEGDQSA